jgi:hypothetical protein
LTGARIGRQQAHARKALCCSSFCDVDSGGAKRVFIPFPCCFIVDAEDCELSGRRSIGKSVPVALRRAQRRHRHASRRLGSQHVTKH